MRTLGIAKKTLIGIVVAIIIIAVIAGVVASLYLAPAPGKKKLTFALLVSNLGNPYFVMLKDGAEAAVKELKAKGIEVELIVYDAKDDPDLQVRQIEEAIAKKVDALLINPVHKEAILPAVRDAVKAGIIVITTDRDIADKSLRVFFTGTDNVYGAELAVKALIEALEKSGKPKPWKIVILHGIPGTTAAEDRKKGFHNVLDPLVKKGDVKIVAEEIAYFRRDKGLEVMESILARTKEIDAVICANDEMALGAIQAIEGAGLVPGKDIIVVGYDAIPDAVEAVKAGKMYATIAQSPFLQGYWAVMGAYYIVVKGWKPPKDFIPTPVVVVTKANVGTFSEEVAKPKPLPGAPSE
ncbi:MAG: D-ribose ABC transporter substrate-binding protein [Thermoprotei archaeon]|nr:MAG: D-ribose ABC transporter substrate-binding protein [Thermoprotei archaeon]